MVYIPDIIYNVWNINHGIFDSGKHNMPHHKVRNINHGIFDSGKRNIMPQSQEYKPTHP